MDFINLFDFVFGSLAIIISVINITKFSFKNYRGKWYWLSWFIIFSQLISLYLLFNNGMGGIYSLIELLLITALFISIGILTVKMYNKLNK